jgi:hypothetical protein
MEDREFLYVCTRERGGCVRDSLENNDKIVFK